MSFPVELNDKASIVVSQNDYGGSPSQFELILNKQSSFVENRLLYCKEANTGLYQSRVLPISTLGYTFQSNQQPPLYLYSNDAIQLHLASNMWNVLGGFSPSGGWDCNFPGTFTPFPKSFSTTQAPVDSVIVNPSMDTSLLFVDLRNESKTLVLPRIEDLIGTGQTILAPFYTIKDVYGNSAFSSLFISTSAGDILDSATTCSNATKINSNYASIDIFPNLDTIPSKWHILNYFNGQVSTAGLYTTEGIEAPINLTSYVSSAITYVDTDEETKLILLPPANTVVGTSFYIKDLPGNGYFSSIFVSTQTNDLIDDFQSSIVLGYNYHCARFTAFSTTRYSLTLDYPWANLPFTQRF